MLPTCGFRVHVTGAFVIPVMVKVNAAVWPPVRFAVAGDKLMVSGVRVMLAVAVLVGSITLAPVTAASKAAEAPAPTDTVVGPTVTAIGCNETMAVAVFVESAALVAVFVMVCWLAITGGAW